MIVNERFEDKNKKLEEEKKLRLIKHSPNRIIKIPKKVAKAINHILIKELLTINEDVDVSKELLLIFLSKFTSNLIKGDKPTFLFSVFLKENFGKYNYRFIYTKIIKMLEKGTRKKGSIIKQISNHDTFNHKSRSYMLTKNYLGFGYENYELKTDKAIEVNMKIIEGKLDRIRDNVIVNNCLSVYDLIIMPSVEEVQKYGEELVKYGYCTKKGKRLKKLGHKKREDGENHVYLEDHIKIFKYLADMKIPSIGDHKSGGRVVDKFTLMPSWIRPLIRFKGDYDNLVELDFVSFHPNLADYIYSDNPFHINHAMVADYLNIKEIQAKQNHVSFFNLNVFMMKKSRLYKYYAEKKPMMLEKIIEEKEEHGYKITSSKLFTLETELMRQAIAKLNARGIYGIYLYDALIAPKRHAEEVKKVMDGVAMCVGIKTHTKAEELKKIIPTY